MSPQPTKEELIARRKELQQRQHELAQKRQRIRKRVQKIGIRAHNLAHRIKHYRKPEPVPDQCWDSTNIHGIPAAAAHQAVGCYGAGTYKNFALAKVTFPDAWLVVFMPGASFDIDPEILAYDKTMAIILDIEPGCAVPSAYPGWFKKWRPRFKKALGKYSMRSEWSQISQQSGDKDWLADPTGTPHNVAGFDAVQDIWSQDWDHSTVAPSLWN